MRSTPALALAAALAVLAALSPARAADAPGQAAAGLKAAVAHGAQLFASSSFGGNGTCETCHQNGGRTAGKLPNGMAIPSLVGAAASFPQYHARAHRVVTLSQQLDHCIAGALQGTPPAPDSTDLADLEAYIASLSKGAVMGKQFD
jgi:thiosulfate dehydrogenase